MNLSRLILKIAGWKVNVAVPEFPKSIICVAPHTSNWDFILCELAIRSVNRHSGFLMKESWFFFPLGNIFKAMGGIPVSRKEKKGSLVEQIVEKYKNSERLTLAVTPEGTRKRTAKWRSGFLRIAEQADVPICLAYVDFGTKTIGMEDTFAPSGDIEKDLHDVKHYYKNFTGRYPDKFTIE